MDLMRSLLVRDTFRELEDMADRLNRLVGGSAGTRVGSQETMARADWAPAVDVVETDTEFQILAELPGLEKEDVKLSVEGGVLAISGRREPMKEGKGTRIHRLERASGSFLRSFSVPDSVDETRVKANYRNGILTVHLPKTEKAKPRSIEVKVE
ncbi:MAG TPA: Hsp20/alpha crystallin family protein [Nitrospiraceae bacterium]|jgi:HSP20 family protein|nr:Hsp20/alpha crystallin family protein [Nitrospiraceae bacterium]